MKMSEQPLRGHAMRLMTSFISESLFVREDFAATAYTYMYVFFGKFS